MDENMDKEKAKLMGKEIAMHLNSKLKKPWRVNSVTFSHRYGYLNGKTSGAFDKIIFARANFSGKCHGFRIQGFVQSSDVDELEKELLEKVYWYNTVSLKDYALSLLEGYGQISAQGKRVLKKVINNG